MPDDEGWVPLRQAWDRALYAETGFYRSGALPRDHFRTSVHASPIFARALLTLAGRLEVARVVDIGAGAGEMLTQLHALGTDLDLMAVEVRPRPDGLPAQIAWRTELPADLDGLVVANEVVDNIACDVVEVDNAGVARIVEIAIASGRERLGDPIDVDAAAWLDRWWPLRGVGERAEIGLPREHWWGDVTQRLRSGACLAIDYGHTLPTRPPLGSIASYREGRVARLGFGGDRDITADVAVDALQDYVGGTLRRQADCLAGLGITAQRPPVQLASTDPRAYVRGLSEVGEVVELTASPGLGDFWWLLSGPGGSQLDMGA